MGQNDTHGSDIRNEWNSQLRGSQLTEGLATGRAKPPINDESITCVTTKPSINQLGIIIESLSTDAVYALMTGVEILQISSP